MPTPQHTQALERILWHCRTLYNTALEERKTAWERCCISINYYQQKAELPDLKSDFPEFAAVYSQVLQDVLLRLDRTFQAFFRRLKAGEAPGYPRFQSCARLPLPTCVLINKRQTSRHRSAYRARSRQRISTALYTAVDNVRAVNGRAEGAMSDDTRQPTTPAPSGFARRVHGWSIGRGQRSCAACGRYLPLAWTDERCQSCQDSGRVPRPPHKRRHAVAMAKTDGRIAQQ
jgi:hypothetical protein